MQAVSVPAVSKGQRLKRRLSGILKRAPWVFKLLYFVWRRFRTKYSIGAVGIVFNPDGDVLLVEHTFHPEHPWGLPGGWVDRDERPTDTVIREMTEELGIRAHVQQVVQVDVPFPNHLDIAILCTVDDLTIHKLSYELLDYGWFSPDALPRLQQFHYQAIRQAMYVRNNQDGNLYGESKQQTPPSAATP